MTKEDYLRLDSYIAIKPFDQCHEWTGAKIKGYGNLLVNGRSKRATRLVWERHYGKITSKQYVLHKCDNPGCCRIDHLFLGNQKTNMADMMQKKRSAIHTGKHPHAKLDFKIADEIRSKYIRFSYKRSNAHELAKEYGVHASSIRQIVSGRSYPKN